MRIKCHVTARVKRSGSVGRSKLMGETEASLMKDGVKTLSRGGGILRDTHTHTHRGYKELSFTVFLATSLSPPDGPTLVGEKDTLLYTTLPLHTAVWRF